MTWMAMEIPKWFPRASEYSSGLNRLPERSRITSSSWNCSGVSKGLAADALRCETSKPRSGIPRTRAPLTMMPGSLMRDESMAIINLMHVLELPDDTQDHLLLAAREVQALVSYSADHLVPQNFHRLPIDYWQLFPLVEEVGRMDTEHLRQGDHLGHGRVRDGPVPDPLHYLFGKGAETHAGYLSVRVGLA